MAITACYAEVIHSIAKGCIPIKPGGHMIEFGQANWYGDLSPKWLVERCEEMCPERMPEVRDLLKKAHAAPDQTEAYYRMGLVFYHVFFAPKTIGSIDMHALELPDTGNVVWKYDLNLPLPYMEQADYVLNNGTAEHIFNIGQAFASAHSLCKPGGIMIHEAPAVGWINHGFYAIQPTLYWDVAHYNNYDVLGFYLMNMRMGTIIDIEHMGEMSRLIRGEQVPSNVQVCCAFRKGDNGTFQYPMQAAYDDRLDETGVQAWRMAR